MTYGGTKPWWVTLRSRSRAVLWLTLRDDLRVIYQSNPAAGVDMLVTVLHGGQISGRQFGVVLAARRSGSAAPRLNGKVIAHERAAYSDATFPIAMLAFSSNNGAGWFRWIVEPIVDDEGAELERSSRIYFEPTTDELLDQVMDEVNAWYDARSSTD